MPSTNSTVTRDAIQTSWTSWFPRATSATSPLTRLPKARRRGGSSRRLTPKPKARCMTSRAGQTARAQMDLHTESGRPAMKLTHAARRVVHRTGARPVLATALRAPATSTGFTYIRLLFFVALMGAALVGVAQVWHTQVQRDKEEDLLFVGNQFRRAISLYYERAPGGARQYPRQMEDLLQDPRYPNVQRHLRKLYVDPVTGKPDWGLVKAPDGSIIG